MKGSGRCPPAEAWSAYVDGETSPWEGLGLRAHLRSCPACGREVRAVQAVRRAVRAAPAPPMPEDLRKALEDMTAGTVPLPAALGAYEAPRTARADRRASRPPPWISFLPRPAVLAPAAAAVLLAALWLSRRPGPAPAGGLAARETELPLELIVSAHDRYALTLPLAPADEIYSEPPAQLASGSLEAGDVY